MDNVTFAEERGVVPARALRPAPAPPGGLPGHEAIAARTNASPVRSAPEVRVSRSAELSENATIGPADADWSEPSTLSRRPSLAPPEGSSDRTGLAHAPATLPPNDPETLTRSHAVPLDEPDPPTLTASFRVREDVPHERTSDQDDDARPTATTLRRDTAPPPRFTLPPPTLPPLPALPPQTRSDASAPVAPESESTQAPVPVPTRGIPVAHAGGGSPVASLPPTPFATALPTPLEMITTPEDNVTRITRVAPLAAPASPRPFPSSGLGPHPPAELGPFPAWTPVPYPSHPTAAKVPAQRIAVIVTAIALVASILVLFAFRPRARAAAAANAPEPTPVRVDPVEAPPIAPSAANLRERPAAGALLAPVERLPPPVAPPAASLHEGPAGAKATTSTPAGSKASPTTTAQARAATTSPTTRAQSHRPGGHLPAARPSRPAPIPARREQ